MPTSLDALDRKILVALQQDATQSLEALARVVGSSKTPVWNRVQRLKRDGVIRAQVAVLDPRAVGRGLCAFVLVKTNTHTAEWLERFSAMINAAPEALEAHRLAGKADYVLEVRVADISEFDQFYQRMTREVSVHSVTSALSMEALKEETALPITPP